MKQQVVYILAFLLHILNMAWAETAEINAAEWRFFPGEHPRLLFNAADLPAARQQMQTPAGAEIMQKLEAMLQRAYEYGFGYHAPAAEHSMGNVWAAGHALRYKLSGDPVEARRAEQLCQANLFGNYYYGGGWLHPYTLIGTALSYDLCAEAWSPAFRSLVFAYLERNVRELSGLDLPDLAGFDERYDFANSQKGFTARGSSDTRAVNFRAAGVIAALSILGDFPDTTEKALQQISPAKDYKPWIGVPVVPFEDDIMPRIWLINGPFLHGKEADAMNAVGGFAAARPEPGTTVLSDGVPVEFRRYHPNNWQQPEGPAVYARNCSRYWASSTGGGYQPGIRLIRRWREAKGFNPSLNVVLYTVISNDAPRTVQACPNWRSRSFGTEMWLNGVKLADGALAELEPGLYPLMINLPLRGGYSQQAPRLREFSREMQATAQTRLEAAEAVYSNPRSPDNPMLPAMNAMWQYVQEYIRQELGPDDVWGLWETQETLLPLLFIASRLRSEPVAVADRLQNIMPLTSVMRKHWASGKMDYMVSHGIFLMPQAHLPAARHHIENYSAGLRRPVDCLFALLQYPNKVQPFPAAKLFNPWRKFTSRGIYAMQNGRDGADAALLLLRTGVDNPGLETAGTVYLHAKGRPWFFWREGNDPLNANNLLIENRQPRKTALIYENMHTNGSGSLTLEMTDFEETRPDRHNKLRMTGKQSPVAVRRAVAIDFSDPETLLLVKADVLTATDGLEKRWRYDIGRTGYDARATRRLLFDKTPAGPYFQFTPASEKRYPACPDGSSLRVNMITDEKIEFKAHAYSRGSESFVDTIMEKKLTAVEKAVDVTGLTPAGTTGDSIIDDMLLEFEETAAQNDRAQGNSITVMTVITIRHDENHPAITVLQKGDRPAVQLGERIVEFDGQILLFKEAGQI